MPTSAIVTAPPVLLPPLSQSPFYGSIGSEYTGWNPSHSLPVSPYLGPAHNSANLSLALSATQSQLTNIGSIWSSPSGENFIRYDDQQETFKYEGVSQFRGVLQQWYENILLQQFKSVKLHYSHHLRQGSTASQGHLGPFRQVGSTNLSNDTVWPPDRQYLFEDKIAQLTASAGLAFSWVENPEWISLYQEFIPSAQLPSRETLSDRILPRALNNIWNNAKKSTRGQHVTVQCDGWTALNNSHFQAFMVTTKQQEV